MVKSSRIFVETKHGVLFVLIGPMVYLVSAVVFFAASHISFFLTSPILFAFVVFSLTLYIKEFSMKTHGVAILFVCYMYAYSVFPTFEIIGEQLAEKKQLTELLQE